MGRASKFDASFMAKVAIEALQEKETLQALAKKYGVAPCKIEEWKEKLLQNYSKAFESHSNYVWSTDISYIPMRNGFMYLYAIIDVYSRYLLGWRLSNSLSANNAYELLQECIDIYGAPEIVNTDQGRQYTTAEWEKLLRRNGILISMDGKGRCKDNIWIERFWRSIKQDYIYTHPTDDVMELRKGIDGWIRFYNCERPHQGLDGRAPSMVFAAA